MQGLRAGEEPANSHHRQDLQGPRHHRSVHEPSTRCPARDWALQLTLELEVSGVPLESLPLALLSGVYPV